MKNYRVVFATTARNDLLNIAEYISLDNPIRALSFIKEMVKSFEKTLSIFPESGQLYTEHNFGSTIRIISYGKYKGFYQVNKSEKIVEMLYIFNSKQDIAGFIQGL